jgi:transglutaminase-like putative cysteine protease
LEVDVFRTIIALGLALLLYAAPALAQNARHFTFDYGFVVRNAVSGQDLRVWVPLAHNDRFQQVSIISIKGDLAVREQTDPKTGNEMLYGETTHVSKAQYKFTIVYDVIRRERSASTDAAAIKTAPKTAPSEAELAADLLPNQLVPVSGVPADLAVKTAAGQVTEMGKARAIYDYVFNNMRYDKTGTGWGRGDTLFACDLKRGNCTDFHSLFISMVRSQQIPSRFEIGFSLPADSHAGRIEGYHCWADFYVPARGWMPVDISEAWKHPTKRDYFFGSLDTNRVQFTIGRDLRLTPPQVGPPLNYFVYPYVEVDRKPYSNVVNNFSFADKDSSSLVSR